VVNVVFTVVLVVALQVSLAVVLLLVVVMGSSQPVDNIITEHHYIIPII